jgi:ankyrin repeat protein
LIKNKADCNILDYDGVGPLYLAILNSYYDCVKVLVKNKARHYFEESELRDISPIFLCIRKQSTIALDILFNSGASILIENSEGLSPLMIASMNGYNDIVAYLALRSHDLN